MSFLDGVRRELARVGIRGRLARRIEAELADHLACDPHAQLGAADEIAERFAAELRVVRTRRSSLATFGALALCALLTVGAASRNSAPLGPFGGLALLVLMQVAFVAGMLALLGLRARTAGELRLAQRRSLIALLAGAGICLLVVADTLNWISAFALVPLVCVAVAAWRTQRAAAVTPPAPTVPELPAWAWLGFGAIAVMGVFAQGAFFERSFTEGLLRAAIEGTGLAIAVVALGRPLGLRP